MYRIEEIIIAWLANIFKKISSQRILIAIPTIWLLVFFICPCLILLKISLSKGLMSAPPYTSILEWLDGSMLQIRLDLNNYILLFTDEMYIRGFATSLLIAGAVTACCLLIGFPMTYAIARSSERFRTILLMLIVLPFWTSSLIRIYSWILLLSPSGLINSFLLKFGLIEAPLQFMNTTYAACIGMIYTYLPFMIFPLYGAIEKIDVSLIEAASDLGCTPIRAFFSVIVPLSVPGMYAGSALVFVPAIGEYVIPELLGGAQTLTIGRLVWNEFFGNLSWPTASALSIVLLVFIVLPIILMQRRKDMKLLTLDETKNAL